MDNQKVERIIENIKKECDELYGEGLNFVVAVGGEDYGFTLNSSVKTLLIPLFINDFVKAAFVKDCDDEMEDDEMDDFARRSMEGFMGEA